MIVGVDLRVLRVPRHAVRLQDDPLVGAHQAAHGADEGLDAGTYVRGRKKTGARTDKKTFWAKKGSQGQEKHAGVKPVRLFLTELFEGSSEKCPGPASDAPSSSLEM